MRKKAHDMVYCSILASHATGMPKEINKAKIACLDFSLQKAKMQLGISVVVDDPEKLEAIRRRYVENVYLFLDTFHS